MFSILLDDATKDSDREKVNFNVPNEDMFQTDFTYVIRIMNDFQAAQNLVVLSRDEGGAEQIFRNDGVKLIQKLLQSKQEEVVLSALRTLVGLCTEHQSRVSMTKTLKDK